jgi:carbonic anhydrase
MSIQELVEGLTAFHRGYFKENRQLFEQLSEGQHPEVLFISCADSRVDPSLITQSAPGALFVLRNAGNMIPTYGEAHYSEGAGIELAIQSLGIRTIIVCGHSQCGAMKALLNLDRHVETVPLVHAWLKRHGEATRRVVLDNYKTYNQDQLLRIAIEQNVLTQVEHLSTHPVVRSHLHAGTLNIYAWIYEIESGKVFTYDPDARQFVLLQQNPLPIAADLARTRSD